MPTMECELRRPNQSIGMQHAYRLYFGETGLKREEAYQIKKNYPKECHVMFGRALVSDGILSENDLNEDQLSFIEKKFIELLDLAYENPKASLTASCVYLGGMTAAIVFFCRYISHRGF